LAVDGEPKPFVDRIRERIRVLFTDVLGQTNVRRKPGPGIAHTLIFFGFLAIQPHSLELMVQGVIPVFHPGYLFPDVYKIYLYVADILGFFVLAGFIFALYRRLVIKPDYLTMGKDANLIILFTSVIILSFHFINAFQMMMPVEAGAFSYAGIFPVSGVFASVFSLGALSQSGIMIGYEIFYYIHIGTILGFLIYIPGSKHLHLLAAAPNVFFKRLDIEKTIVKTDIEDEEAETFGLGRVNEFNWHNVLNLYACTECGRCEELCPASNTGKPLSPKKILHDFKVDLLDQSDLLLDDKKDEIQPLMRDGSQINDDVLWACTTCRSCEDICPVNNEHLNFIFEMRKHQVLMEANFPSEMQETFNNMENQSNPWGFSADSRADWCKDMGVPLMSEKSRTRVLWFVGCAGSFDDRGKKISQATARILQKAGVDFAILGSEESCNGDMARRAGNEYLAQMMIQQNAETFGRYEFDTILTGCPHCYNTIKNEYPDFGADYNVVHTADYFNTLIKSGRLNINQKDFGNLTFHDSCYLGRWNNIYESPRDILKTVHSGNLIEMDRTKSKGFCCGAGGARMFMEETIGERINNARAHQVIESGATSVASSCPFCATMLNDGIMETGKKIDVKDIAQILDEATS
ncbi:MAG: (Fe-S)-binding protein, partial [Desulfobacula sp.]|nr:(Fe-S)-binding protein [Desulfobacula sp.]